MDFRNAVRVFDGVSLNRIVVGGQMMDANGGAVAIDVVVRCWGSIDEIIGGHEHRFTLEVLLAPFH